MRSQFYWNRDERTPKHAFINKKDVNLANLCQIACSFCYLKCHIHEKKQQRDKTNKNDTIWWLHSWKVLKQFDLILKVKQDEQKMNKNLPRFSLSSKTEHRKSFTTFVQIFECVWIVCESEVFGIVKRISWQFHSYHFEQGITIREQVVHFHV